MTSPKSKLLLSQHKTKKKVIRIFPDRVTENTISIIFYRNNIANNKITFFGIQLSKSSTKKLPLLRELCLFKDNQKHSSQWHFIFLPTPLIFPTKYKSMIAKIKQSPPTFKTKNPWQIFNSKKTKNTVSKNHMSNKIWFSQYIMFRTQF